MIDALTVGGVALHGLKSRGVTGLDGWVGSPGVREAEREFGKLVLKYFDIPARVAARPNRGIKDKTSEPNQENHHVGAS